MFVVVVVVDMEISFLITVSSLIVTSLISLDNDEIGVVLATGAGAFVVFCCCMFVVLVIVVVVEEYGVVIDCPEVEETEDVILSALGFLLFGRVMCNAAMFLFLIIVL